MVVRPADGGTVSSLRFKPADVELINSLMRRPEPYHALVRRHVTSKESPREGPASIHDQVLSKETNLDALLRYDRYARHCFRTYLFPASKQWRDFEYLTLDENGSLAQGAWKVVRDAARTSSLDLQNEAWVRVDGHHLRVEAQKTIAPKVQGAAWQIECQLSFTTNQSCLTPLAVGIEMVFNLLARDAPDRYFLANEVRQPLDFRGEILAPRLDLVDEWQRVRITLDSPAQPRWWIVPIETISQSESGFERVYQGSAILLVWPLEPPPWQNLTRVLRVEISPWNPLAKSQVSAT
jgi:alpha-amylase